MAVNSAQSAPLGGMSRLAPASIIARVAYHRRTVYRQPRGPSFHSLSVCFSGRLRDGKYEAGCAISTTGGGKAVWFIWARDGASSAGFPAVASLPRVARPSARPLFQSGVQAAQL